MSKQATFTLSAETAEPSFEDVTKAASRTAKQTVKPNPAIIAMLDRIEKMGRASGTVTSKAERKSLATSVAAHAKRRGGKFASADRKESLVKMAILDENEPLRVTFYLPK